MKAFTVLKIVGNQMMSKILYLFTSDHVAQILSDESGRHSSMYVRVCPNKFPVLPSGVSIYPQTWAIRTEPEKTKRR